MDASKPAGATKSDLPRPPGPRRRSCRYKTLTGRDARSTSGPLAGGVAAGRGDLGGGGARRGELALVARGFRDVGVDHAALLQGPLVLETRDAEEGEHEGGG